MFFSNKEIAVMFSPLLLVELLVEIRPLPVIVFWILSAWLFASLLGSGFIIVRASKKLHKVFKERRDNHDS